VEPRKEEEEEEEEEKALIHMGQTSRHSDPWY
jgi:hypothetical protein